MHPSKDPGFAWPPELPGRLLIVALALPLAVVSGCGGASSSTAVVVLASSTANGQLFKFPLTVESLTLTSRSGATVTLVSSPVEDEFIHLNGAPEPLASAAIPRGVYTSATATASVTTPACAGLESSGSLLMNDALAAPSLSPTVTVDLPQPIIVTGDAMALDLDLDVSRSAPFSGGCSDALSGTVNVTPIFNLRPASLPAGPAGSTGRLSGLVGIINSVDSGGAGATITGLSAEGAPTTPVWHVALNDATELQGIDTAQLATGLPVDLDVAIEADGSLAATRLEALDTSSANLTVYLAQPLSTEVPSVCPLCPVILIEEEATPPGAQTSVVTWAVNDDGAYFQVSGQFNNLQSLPFTASFGASTLVDGEKVLFLSHAPPENGNTPIPLPATSVTLLPQTIDGTVSAVGSEGQFTTYTVKLAAYDLFPNLAALPYQTALLTTPDTVTVYADSGTAMMTTGPVAPGSLVRLRGLVFNDGGVLRMDCAQVSDGVAE